MSKVKLGDVAIEHKETCGGSKDGYPIVGLEHLTPEEVTLTAWDEDSDNTFTKVFRKGNVLFGRRRAYLRKAAVAPFDGICSGDITVIEAIPDRILPELLPFIIQNDGLFSFAVGKSAGSLSPRVKWEHLKNYEFELPSMDRQCELAELLWAMDTTKKSYQKLIAATDELVKSQFMELFGGRGPRSAWPMVSVGKMGENLDSKRIPITSGSRKPGPYPYYGASGIVDYIDDYIFDENILLISEDGANLVARVTPIAFSAAGKIWVNNHAHVMRFENMATQTFVETYLNSISLTDYITGTAQPKLNQEKLNSIPIPCPPLPLQEQFAAFVQQSDKSKFELEQALAELNATYKRIIAENLG